MKRSVWSSGGPFIWLTGSALAASLLMALGLTVLVTYKGILCFWPTALVKIVYTEKNGQEKQLLGLQVGHEQIPASLLPAGSAPQYRTQYRTGNRSISNLVEFYWIDDDRIKSRETPEDAVYIERNEWGPYMGFMRGSKRDGRFSDTATTWSQLDAQLGETHTQLARILVQAKDVIGRISAAQQRLNVEEKSLIRRNLKTEAETRRLEAERKELSAAFEREVVKLRSMQAELKGELELLDLEGKASVTPLAQVVRIFCPNTLGFFGKLGIFFSRVSEFIFGEPRESNTEGGVFPALFGTVMLVLLMTLIVTPMGVIAAVYLREYAKQGMLVSIVRIAVNNLAGVPSIVYGVFGVGLFIYILGGKIDALFFPDERTFHSGGIFWASLTLAILTLPVVIVATEEGLGAVPNGLREASLALGATKWETVWRVAIPAALPSILTGAILAVARAAGEVAPLMLTGVVKMAPALPLDGQWPYLHPERQFMHLGFFIYDLGFQSPNADAARPMVFATTLLLLTIVLILNLGAILLRNRLKKRYAGSAV